MKIVWTIFGVLLFTVFMVYNHSWIICMVYVMADKLGLVPGNTTAPHDYYMVDEKCHVLRCQNCGWYSWDGGQGWKRPKGVK
jgi:hypothetical protein